MIELISYGVVFGFLGLWLLMILKLRKRQGASRANTSATNFNFLDNHLNRVCEHDDSYKALVNPATGLPMTSQVMDAGGNPYGISNNREF